jgi:hypothetical protein
VLCLWAAKGGAGCSVTAAAIALLGSARTETLLVDLGGEQPAVLGLAPDEDGPGLGDWLARADPPPPDALARLERPVVDGLRLLACGPAGDRESIPPLDRVALLAQLLAGDARLVVVDLGRWATRWSPLLERAGARLLVTRPCYLALRAVAGGPTPTGVVLVDEPGRALSPADVSAVADAPVLARVPWDPAIARVIDAGLLASRLPRPLRRLEALLPAGTTP